MSEFLVGSSGLGQDATLEATHVEQQVGVVLAVDGHEAALPLDSCDGTGEPGGRRRGSEGTASEISGG